MCGLIYARSVFPLPFIRKQYLEQKSRGSNGFGYIALQNGKIVENIRLKYEHETLHSLLKQKNADEIMFHHRAPTSTPNLEYCNHPIIAEKKDKNFALIHNGIISNCHELKAKHEKEGIAYKTIIENQFNDSESLLHELIGNITDEKLIEAEGSFAFILMEYNKDNTASKLYYGTNGTCPLYETKMGTKHYIASQLYNGDFLKKDTLYLYDYETKTYSQKELKVPKQKGLTLGNIETLWDLLDYAYRRKNTNDLTEVLKETEKNLDEYTKSGGKYFIEYYEEIIKTINYLLKQ